MIEDRKGRGDTGDYVREAVSRLCANSLGRNHSVPGSLEAARLFIGLELAASGCGPSFGRYRSGGVERVNIVGSLGPAGGPRILVGAHYDTVEGSPGADDNASAVAVMLAAARLLAGRRLPLRVDFVAFDAEEPPFFATGAMGSRRHASRLRSDGVELEFMLCLESLGFFEDKPWKDSIGLLASMDDDFGTGAAGEALGALPDAGDFLALVGCEGDGVADRLGPSIGAGLDFGLHAAELPERGSPAWYSDSQGFHEAGFRTLMLTDTAMLRNPHYHGAGDLPATLNYRRLGATAEAVADAIANWK